MSDEPKKRPRWTDEERTKVMKAVDEDGKSYDEVAQEMGRPVSAIRLNYSKARKAAGLPVPRGRPKKAAAETPVETPVETPAEETVPEPKETPAESAETAPAPVETSQEPHPEPVANVPTTETEEKPKPLPFDPFGMDMAGKMAELRRRQAAATEVAEESTPSEAPSEEKLNVGQEAVIGSPDLDDAKELIEHPMSQEYLELHQKHLNDVKDLVGRYQDRLQRLQDYQQKVANLCQQLESGQLD